MGNPDDLQDQYYSTNLVEPLTEEEDTGEKSMNWVTLGCELQH